MLSRSRLVTQQLYNQQRGGATGSSAPQKYHRKEPIARRELPHRRYRQEYGKSSAKRLLLADGVKPLQHAGAVREVRLSQ